MRSRCGRVASRRCGCVCGKHTFETARHGKEAELRKMQGELEVRTRVRTEGRKELGEANRKYERAKSTGERGALDIQICSSLTASSILHNHTAIRFSQTLVSSHSGAVPTTPHATRRGTCATAEYWDVRPHIQPRRKRPTGLCCVIKRSAPSRCNTRARTAPAYARVLCTVDSWWWSQNG